MSIMILYFGLALMFFIIMVSCSSWGGNRFYDRRFRDNILRQMDKSYTYSYWKDITLESNRKTPV